MNRGGSVKQECFIFLKLLVMVRIEMQFGWDILYQSVGKVLTPTD